jgi:hypothetical protein
MKRILFCVFLCLFLKNGITQIAFYDALALKNVIVSNKIVISGTKENYAILSKYMSVENPGGSEIVQEFQDNPFFIVAGEEMNETTRFPSSKGILGSIGGINVTNFADGLARFMVKRFKEELNLAFFQKFKDEIAKYEELKTLFSETYKLLMAIDKEIYRYNMYIITLREAFIKDLSNLYRNLEKLFRLPKYRKFLDEHPVLKTILTASLYIIDSLSRGEHAGEILAEFPVEDLNFNDAALTKNVQGSIVTMKLFSMSIRSRSEDRYWISSDSLRLLFKSSELIKFRIFLGLIYQDAKRRSIEFNNGHKLTVAFKELGEHLDKLRDYRDFVEKIGDKAEEINEYIKELKSKLKLEIDYNDYYKLFSASLDIIEQAFSVIDLPYVNNIIPAAEKDKIVLNANNWLFVARSASEVYIDVRTKNYSSAILNTVIVLDTLTNDLVSAVKQKLLKYGTFMAAIASAENSEDVAKVIEAVALPVGGSGIKKHSSFNIAIQSYLGGSYGKEIIKELKMNQEKKVLSVFAPVGISFSWGLMKKWKNPGSIGISANVIDIGALASFRLKDDSTAINSNIELRNIFAPGAYLVIGLPGFPVSIGYGFQTGPQLRDIKQGVPTFETKKIYNRNSFFIAVDIPLFNLYNKAQ